MLRFALIQAPAHTPNDAPGAGIGVLDRLSRLSRIGRHVRRAGLAAIVAAGPVGHALATDEVPFITTPDHVTVAMLELAAVGPRDHVIDLGSGDGRIVITAARRFGASGLGVEIVPDLVRASRENARRAGVAERVEFRVQDLFATDLGRATVVTMYLLPDLNLKLRPRLLQLAPGTRVVSHDWDLGAWQPDRSVTLDVPEKTVGREKRSRLHLWVVPADIHGSWCAQGGGARLQIGQHYQHFWATLDGGGLAPLAVFDGRIEGTRLQAAGDVPVALALEGPTSAPTLRLQRLPAAAADFDGRRFERRPGGCEVPPAR